MLLYLLGACSQTPHQQTVALHTASARQTAARDVLDLGVRGSRARLLEGWGADERDVDGTTYVWSTDKHATIDCKTSSSLPIEVSFRAHAYEFEGLPEQSVGLDVGGGRVEVAMLPDWQTYRVVLPPGPGPLELDMGFAIRPEDIQGNGDLRHLGVAIDHIAIQQSPAPDNNTGITLAPGSSARWRVRLEEAGTLRIQSSEELTLHINGSPHSTEQTPLSADIHTIQVSSRTHNSFQAFIQSSGRIEIAPRPSVVVYVVDSLRAEHGPCPADCSTAITFEKGRAHAPWTRPSVASIFTGLLPAHHGTTGKEQGLAPSLVTLAEHFADEGYETRAVVTNSIIPASMGFDQGFSVYQHLRERLETRSIYVGSDEVNEYIADWLSTRADAPFFLYVHTSDPHFPYTPGPSREILPEEVGGHAFMEQLREGNIEDAASHRQELLDRYQQEVITNLDRFRALRLLLPEDTVVVFTSDHGEEFLDHGGWEHGSTLFGEMLDVPLVLYGTGSPPTQRVLGRHIDILPTLLGLIWRPLSEPGDGIDLLRERATHNIANLGLPKSHQDALEVGSLKLIADQQSGNTTLYNRQKDPGEHHPIEDFDREKVLLEWLNVSRARPEDIPLEGMDAATRERLQALGYLPQDP